MSRTYPACYLCRGDCLTRRKPELYGLGIPFQNALPYGSVHTCRPMNGGGYPERRFYGGISQIEAIPQHHLQAGTSNSTLARPPLVGRSAEMDQLAARLSRAAGGQGWAMFLAGEAGIGKTRLAHEALVLAREQGFLVLEGPAYALEGRLAYAPILAAFGPFLRRLDSPRQARLVSGLPDLGQLFADLRLPAPLPLGDPALEKTRLFEAVARLLERLTREALVPSR